LAGDKLYGVTGDGKIITVNPSWGGTSLVYDTHAASLGLAFNPLNDSLYIKDQNSGVTIYNIASQTLTTMNFSGISHFTSGLAFNPEYSALYSLDQAAGNLISYNFDDLTVSTIGSYVDAAEHILLSSIATDSAGDIFASDEGDGRIFQLNPSTGHASLANGLPFTGFSPLAIDGTGDLFGITTTFGPAALYSGLLTGTPRVRGGIDPIYTVAGLAFSSLESAPIPEPATWAMMLLGFAGLGAMLRRRAAVALPAT